MSGATVVEFLAYWQKEGEACVRRGDYEWMAAQVPGQRGLGEAHAVSGAGDVAFLGDGDERTQPAQVHDTPLSSVGLPASIVPVEHNPSRRLTMERSRYIVSVMVNITRKEPP